LRARDGHDFDIGGRETRQVSYCQKNDIQYHPKLHRDSCYNDFLLKISLLLGINLLGLSLRVLRL
jgi:hypothetical protein